MCSMNEQTSEQIETSKQFANMLLIKISKRNSSVHI